MRFHENYIADPKNRESSSKNTFLSGEIERVCR